MRSIWNGAISFGLVSIPVKLLNATENHSVSFRQIHKEDGGRIRYRKICELDDEEVETAEIGKGYEDADGSVIAITDEELAALPLPTAKTIEILAFVPAVRIDPLQMDSAYYLSANGAPAAKPYALLREALKRGEKVAVAKFALRGRERLGMLRVVGDVIAMHGLLWPDEIRTPEGVSPDTDVTVKDAELDLADALMATLGDIDLSTVHDDYREAVEELVTAKAEGEPLPRQAAEKDGGKVIDLMAALENSVKAAQEAKGDAGDGEAGEGAQVTHLKDRKKKASGSARSGSGSSSGTASRAGASSGRGSGSGSDGKGAAGEGRTAKRTAAGKQTPAKKAAEPRKAAQTKKAAGAKKTAPKRTRGGRASA